MDINALFADQPERAEGLDENLASALLAAVPLRIWEIAHWTPEQRANDAAWAAEPAAFSALVRGLVALAYVEGGVTVAGLHWCTAPHIECPGRPVALPGREGCAA